MLTMNVAKLSHAELADAVSRHCAQFGDVGEITILQPTDKPQVAFALVAMKSAGAIDQLVDNLGAARVESLAVPGGAGAGRRRGARRSRGGAATCPGCTGLKTLLRTAMIANLDSEGRSARGRVLTAEDMHWLHQLETVAPTRALLPMRATEKLGRLGLIELRASKLTLTDPGRQLLNRL
jgi:hypothetical protein